MFIVGGHDHEPEFEEGTDATAAIMKGASNARTIWQIDITFDGDVPSISTHKIAVDEGLSKDAEYKSGCGSGPPPGNGQWYRNKND